MQSKAMAILNGYEVFQLMALMSMRMSAAKVDRKAWIFNVEPNGKGYA
jgi:hypothetical protein